MDNKNTTALVKIIYGYKECERSFPLRKARYGCYCVIDLDNISCVLSSHALLRHNYAVSLYTHYYQRNRA